MPRLMPQLTVFLLITIFSVAGAASAAAADGRTVRITVGERPGWQPGGVFVIDDREVKLASPAVFGNLAASDALTLRFDCSWSARTVTIPAGTFTQGDQAGVGNSFELPLRQVTLSRDFQLAATEVTNAQYAAMLNWALDPNGDGNGADAYIEVDDPTTPTTVRNVGTDPRDDTTAWQQQEILELDASYCQIVWEGGAFGIKDVTGHPDGATDSRANHPVVEVSWYGSQFYCWAQNVQAGAATNPVNLVDWSVDPTIAGWRLPTEAEWEYAARGGWDGGAKYPWWTADPATQKEPDGSQCNGWSDDDAYDGVAGYPYTSPVGDYAANGYGLHDMAGNVWEWCSDWYHSDAYDGLKADGVADEDGTADGVDNDNDGDAVTDPTGPASGSYRVIRGGCWGNAAYHLRCAYRVGYTPAFSFDDLGFRPAQGQGVPAGNS